MLLALTTGRMLGLGALAGLFIVFAVLSAFYFPRRNPDFPGNRLGLFTVVTVVLFVATMAGVVVFAKEGEEAGEHAAAEPGQTTTEEHSVTTAPSGGGATGDPIAGEAVFAANCVACHTLSAAGSSGTVGPNLDEAKPDAALAIDRVTNGKGTMPAFKDTLDEKQIQDVAAYVVASTQG